jgi:hypothetical protein
LQTFLPLANFEETAKCLDYRRLGNQRNEARQMITILEKGNSKAPWYWHPCTRQWRHSIEALKLYYNTIVKEWISRGYTNNLPLYDLKDKIAIFPVWME